MWGGRLKATGRRGAAHGLIKSVHFDDGQIRKQATASLPPRQLVHPITRGYNLGGAFRPSAGGTISPWVDRREGNSGKGDFRDREEERNRNRVVEAGNRDGERGEEGGDTLVR
ncbi:hypothetical protein AAG570_002011 [Ranatra chinensis]|uniref:Uncharacterized protein n=1 Tax=Ranatra chinensis TaxID=642074 RepID=A0ABD0YA68_9HEMI